ncbi:MAG TPA: PAS domain-containing protein [Methylococcaceae bacterium]|nr:PAS domain-containing protein [Methylococcaceae bacterium]
MYLNLLPRDWLIMMLAVGAGIFLVAINRRLRHEVLIRREAEARVGCLNERLQRLIDFSPAAIYSLPAATDGAGNGEGGYISRSLLRMSGYSLEEWRSPGFWAKHLHPEDRGRVEAARGLLMDEGALTQEYRFLCRDGSYIWVHDTLILVSGLPGGAEEIFGSWVEITARKMAEFAVAESEERLRLVLEISGDGFWDWRPGEGRLYFSPRLYALMSFEPGAFPATWDAWEGLIQPDDVEDYRSFMGNLLHRPNGGASHEYRARAGDGTWRKLLVRGHVVARDEDGHPARLVGMITDITGRRPEAGVLPINRDMMLQSHRAKADIVGDINREIRTPLNTLLGFVHLALHAEKDLVRRDYLEGIERAAFALRDTLNGAPRISGSVKAAMPTNPGLFAPGPDEGDAGRSRRVLLVEDHEINRLLAEEMLCGAGYVADSVRDGAEALAKIKAGESYDAVLMDLQMPVMDGFDATRAIRRLFSPGELPIIAMTAHALEEEIEKSRAVGMNDYLIKPIDLEVLQRTLQRWTDGDGQAGSAGKGD